MCALRELTISPQAQREPNVVLPELVAHLRENSSQLREEWVRRITEAELLTTITKEEIFTEASMIYENYFMALEAGAVEALQSYVRKLSARVISRSVIINVTALDALDSFACRTLGDIADTIRLRGPKR